jgi:hypothetical protein
MQIKPKNICVAARYAGVEICDIIKYKNVLVTIRSITSLFTLICLNVLEAGLMFIPCIIRRSRNNQHFALIYTTPLFYILAPTCFGSSLPSSVSFFGPSELLQIQIK